MSRVTYLEAQPRVVGTGATTTVRLAGGGDKRAYFYGGQHFQAGLAAHVRLAAQLGFDEAGWTGGTIPQTGRLVWRPASNAQLDALAALYWPDAAISIWSGDEDGAQPLALTGTVADAKVSEGALVLTLGDLSARLDKPVCTLRFAGTGGVEGGAEAKDRVKRRSWGRCFNVEGRVLDKTVNVYEFGGLDWPWQGFDAVRDAGFAYAPVVTVAWAGSALATLNALKAVAVVAGGAAIAPSIACAKLWTQPLGPVTADVRGEVSSGYVETAPEIVARVSAALGGPAVANVSAMAALRAGVAGCHIGDEQETAAQAIDRTLLGVSLLWVLEPAGTIRLREWTFAAPVAALRAEFVERVQVLPPTKTRRLGYQRNCRVQGEGEIAAALLQLDPEAAGKLGGIAAGATRNVTTFAGTAPANPVDGDIWVDLSGAYAVTRIRSAGAWQAAGTNVTIYSQLTGKPASVADINATESAKLAGIEAGADVTANAQIVVAMPAEALVSCDAGGAPRTNELPRTITTRVTRGGVAITTADSVSFVATRTNLAGAIDNATGSATKGSSAITDMTANEGYLDVVVTVAGVAQPSVRTVFKKQLAQVTAAGGTGAKLAFDETIDTVAAPGFIQISDVLTVTLAAGERLVSSGSLDYYVGGTTFATRSASVYAAYRVKGSGSGFTAMAGANSGTNGQAGRYLSGEWYEATPGNVSAAMAAAGLAVNDYEVVLFGQASATGRTLTFDGRWTVEAKV